MTMRNQIVTVIAEAMKLHADTIHYAPHMGSHKQFKIHKVGSNFAKHVKPGDVVKSSEIDDLADAGARLKQIKEPAMKEEVEKVVEAAVHADAVHYAPHEGSHKQFKIHKVGANFQKHVKPGDVVPSSAIDDLADAGAKLKQIKEDIETVDEAMSHITKTPMVASRPGRETSRVSSTAVDVGGGRKMEMSAKGPKDAARSTYHPASQAKPKGKLPEEVEEFSEEELDESTHMAVHVYPTTKAHTSFKVHKVGAGVKHVKVGDTVSSSDLDDLSDAGHKVKEVKAPTMKEEAEESRAEDKFKKGDKVRDTYGDTHTVMSVTHPMVNMTSGKRVHHTKVFKASK